MLLEKENSVLLSLLDSQHELDGTIAEAVKVLKEDAAQKAPVRKPGKSNGRSPTDDAVGDKGDAWRGRMEGADRKMMWAQRWAA